MNLMPTYLVPRRRPLVRVAVRAVQAALVLAIVGALGFGAVASWPRATALEAPLQTGLTLSRDLPPRGPVGIQAINVAMLWTDVTSSTASITVANSDPQPVTARTWWILGRAGDSTPWVDPVLESVHPAVTIAGHGRASVTATVAQNAKLPPDGTYVLTIWAHTINAAGAEVPSDGVQLAAGLQVAHIAEKISETVQDPSAPVRILEITPAKALAAGRTITITATIGDIGAQQVSVQLELQLVAPSGAYFSAAPISTVLDPGFPVVATSHVTLPVGWSDRYYVRGVLAVLLPNGDTVPAVAATRV